VEGSKASSTTQNDLTLAHIARLHALHTPEQIAFTFLRNGETEDDSVTFTQLDADAQAIAEKLRINNMQGERALLLYPPGIDFVRALLGCFYAGVIAVPAPLPHRTRSLDQRASGIIADASVRVVLGLAAQLDHLGEWESGLTFIRTDDARHSPRSGEGKITGIDADDVAFLQYTSGSTGRPKGVVVTHANLVLNLQLMREVWGYSTETVFICWAPQFHDMGLVGNILESIYMGTHCVLMSPAAFLQDPSRWLRAIARYRGSASGAPNFAFDLCAALSDDKKAGLDLSSWEVAINGSEPVRACTVDRFVAAYRAYGLNSHVMRPAYGLAEATLFVASQKCTSPVTARHFDKALLAKGSAAAIPPGEQSVALVSCGTAWRGPKLAIVSPDRRNCGAGVLGEIWVAADRLPRGYWGRAAESAETFAAHLANGEGPFLRTGDLGFVHDGELFIAGRVKDLIIVRGVNHYPQDIEQTAEVMHPDLVERGAAAFGTEVNGNEVVVLFLEIRKRKPEPDFEAIARSVRGAIAVNHEIAIEQIVFLKRGSLPRTSSGKLRRSECRRRYIEGTLDAVARIGSSAASAPPELRGDPDSSQRIDIRTEITRMAATALDLPEVPPSVKFNALGLDSLRAAQLVRTIADRSGVELDLAEFFLESSVDWLVSRLSSDGLEREDHRQLDGAEYVSQVERFEPFPLTDMQQAYWLGRAGLYDLGQVSLHGYIEIESSDLDIDRLELAVRVLIDRHDMLRAVILADGRQKVLQSVPGYTIQRIDLRTAASIDDELESLRQRLSHEVIPLDVWPPFGVRAVLLPEHKVRLIASIDGTFIDFRSGQVLLRELLRLYSDPAAALDLSPPVKLFRDYVLRRISLQKETGYARSLAFWLDRIKHLPPAPDLPMAKDSASLSVQRVRNLSFHLPAERIDRLRQRLKSEGITQASLMLAAYVEVIGYWSRTPQFTINVPLLGRQTLEREWNYTLGNFSTFVLIGADTGVATDLVTRAASLQRDLLAALQHSEPGGVRLLRELSKRNARSPGSGMPIVFTHFPSGVDDWDRSLASNVEKQLGKIVYAASQTPQVLLDNLIIEQEDGIHIIWEFVEGVFPNGMIEAMFGAYRKLMLELADDPDLLETVRQDLLPADQRRQRDLVNRTEAPIADRTLQSLLRQQARQRPDATAVVCSGRRLSYAELSARSSSVASLLRNEGLQPGQRVAVAMEKGWEQVVAVYGILAAGGVYVPLDVDAPDQRLRQLLQAADVQLIVTQRHLSPRVTRMLEPARRIVEIDDFDDCAGLQAEFPDVAQSPLDPAYVLYTSGSTGEPKGVVVSHRAVINMVDYTNRRLAVGPGDAVLALTALHHDLSVYDIFGLISAGGTIVLPDAKWLRDPAHWLELLQRDRVTIWNSVPALMSMLLAHIDGRGSVRFENLRQVILGGDWIPLDLFHRLRAVSDARLLSIGGPTETTVWNIWYPVQSIQPDWHSVPYGRPIDNTRYFVFDDQLRDRPVWVAGELYCSGASLANGYLGNPVADGEKFLSHPQTGERLYRTGDVGRYLPDGNIEFLGRADFQIKIQGHRIEPGEIEFVLSSHPDVEAAVVVASGAGNQQTLVGYVVPAKDRGLDQPGLDVSLRAYLADRLPPHMVPQKLHMLRELSLTPLGKIDRLALSAMETTTATAASSGTRIRRARSRTERILSTLLSESLGPNDIDPEQNLFELGANSLHIVQLQSEIARRFEKPVRVADIFRHPTLRALAGMLDASNNVSDDVIVGRERARRRRAAMVQGSIAITGMACRFPGAAGIRQFWVNLASGTESIERLTLQELLAQGIDPEFAQRPDYVPAASVLRDVMMFDPDFFAMTPREAAITDPQQRLLLECAYDALCDAGHAPQSFDGPIGVFAGCGYGTYLVNNLSAEFDVINFDAARSLPVLIGNDKDYAATRISYKLNLRGPSVTLGTACSSSLLAVHEACQKLLTHECDMALAGGAKVSMPDRVGYLYQEGGVQSSDGHCRPFDASATGTVFGSGAGLVVLRRLEDAIADNDSIYAVIRGGAVNNDGATKVSYTAPSVSGQVRVIAEAHAVAGVSSSTITYVEAHGTGTLLGDPIEVASLREAFGPASGTRQHCGLGSVKSNLGHLDAAAGIAGLIKTTLALHHGKIPPSLGFSRPNPQIDFADGPFYVNTVLRDWDDGAAPLRAGVSSFGIGGTNVHLVLEQAPSEVKQAASDNADRRFHALTISARSEAALLQMTSDYADELETSPAELADFCFTANTGRNHYQHRLAAVADTKAALREQLKSAGSSRSRLHRGLAKKLPSIAALYGGQGAQYASMGRQLFRTQPTFRETMERCDALFRAAEGGRSLLDVIWAEDDPGLLDQTRFTQPALFAIQWSMTELWRSLGVQSELVLGHSIGEYAAACAAGVFELEDAIKLVSARGRLIDARCKRGAMVAVLQARDRVESIVTGFGPELAIAAENGPASTVLAGTPEAVAVACERLKSAAVRFERLTVSHGFHSPLMQPAVEEFARIARSVCYASPACQIVSTVKGAEVTDEIANPEYWIDHLLKPVLFGQAVRSAERLGADVWLEIGAGRSLVALASHCLDGAGAEQARLIGGLRRGRDEWQEMLESVSKLYVAGAPVRWTELDKQQERRRVRLPGYPYQRIRCAIEPKSPRLQVSKQPVADRFKIVWRNSPIAQDAAPGKRRWLIFADGEGLGEKLAVALKRAGSACILVHPGESYQVGPSGYTVRPDRVDDVAAILEQECNSGSPIEAVLYAWSLDASSALTGEPPDQRASLALRRLLNAVQPIARFESGTPLKFVLLTRGAEPVLANDEIDLAQAPLSAFYKVLALEHPELEPLQFDLDPKGGPEAEGMLLKVLLAASACKQQIAERAGASYLARLTVDPTNESAEPVRLRTEATYWITGGQGAAGLLLAQRLALLGARHVVLTSRRPAMPPAAEQAVAELRRSGVNIVVRPGDVTSRTDAREILHHIERNLPPLAGIFHAAGIVQDAVLLKQSWESFATVLAPKLAGAWNLHDLTRDRTLDHFVMFSSAAALLGSPGQSSYAAANAFLDALAHHRRRLGLPAVSIGWGPWANVGMAAASQAQRNIYRRHLLRPMPADEALGHLEWILRGAGPSTAVISIDWGAAKQATGSLFQPDGPQARILDELMQASGPAAEPPAGLMSSTEKPGSTADGLRAMGAGERPRALAAYMRRQLRDMLDLPIEMPLDSQMPLVDIGLESLTALSLRNRFSHDLGLKLPPTLLYSHPSLDALTRYFESQLFPEDEQREATAPSRPQAEEVQSQFSEMSLLELTGQLEDKIGKILGRGSESVRN
jgi:amino acid adenylation domain-containing protein